MRWQERGPRSLAIDYDSNIIDTYNDSILVKKDSVVESSTIPRHLVQTDSPVTTHRLNTTLDDVFISVKTTRNYHKWRLPVILKTWFQLAKNQVNKLLHTFNSFIYLFF